MGSFARGTFKFHEQQGQSEVRDLLQVAVNGELHTLLTVVCAAACGRNKSSEKESQEGAGAGGQGVRQKEKESKGKEGFGGRGEACS